jgi:type I restriction enzyme S subunit
VTNAEATANISFEAKAVIVPLISSTGHGHASIKRVHYQEGKFALGNILCALIPNDETQLNGKYLHLYLQQFKENLLVPLMKGAANVSLPMNKLADLEIEVPSFKKAIKIIELAEEAAEYKNELEERLIAQDGDVAKLRQAILKEAMQGKLTKQSYKDGAANDLLQKIRIEKEKLITERKLKKERELSSIPDSEIPFVIPQNWSWCKLGNTSPSFKQNIIDGPFGSDLLSSEYTIGGVPIIRLQNIGINKFINKGRKFISIEKAVFLGKHNYRTGDVVICKLGDPPGKTCIIPENEGNGIIVADVVRYRTDNRFLSNKYCSFFLNSKFAIQQFKAHSKGMTRLRVSLELIRELIIPLPPLAEQNRIVHKLEQLMQLCDELQHSIQQSKIENEKLLQGALRDALKKEEVLI